MGCFCHKEAHLPIIIPTKRMSVLVHTVQGRRLVCDSCGQPFTYLVSEIRTHQVMGIPVLNSDDQMRGNLNRTVSADLKATARRRRLGRAPCAHCGKYQRWMKVYPAWLDVLAVLLMFPVFVVVFLGGAMYGHAHQVRHGSGTRAYFQSRPSEEQVFVIAAGAAALSLLLPRWLYRSLDGRVSTNGRDTWRSMPDAALVSHVAESARGGQDPFLRWAFTVGQEKPVGHPVSLGILDETGHPALPEAWNTDRVLTRL
jgi:hypothetical protein